MLAGGSKPSCPVPAPWKPELQIFRSLSRNAVHPETRPSLLLHNRSLTVEAYKRDQLLAGAVDLDRLRAIVDSLMGCIPAMTRVMTTPMPFA